MRRYERRECRCQDITNNEGDAMPNRINLLRKPLVALLCAALIALPIPRASAVSLAEYPLLLTLILILADEVQSAGVTPGSKVVIDQLVLAVEGARAAAIVGNSTAELSRLSKAAGAAQAILGMTASCSDCTDARATLQQIIGRLALFRTSIVGASGSCNPNGIVQPNEQCDPLAPTTGCPTNTIELTYCSDECICEVAIVP